MVENETFTPTMDNFVHKVIDGVYADEIYERAEDLLIAMGSDICLALTQIDETLKGLGVGQ